MTVSLVSVALGALRFKLLQATYDQLRHQLDERWESVDRAGGEPALHWAGHGPQTITIRGAVFPEVIGTIRFPQILREVARTGQPQLFIDGLGFYWGFWVIKSVSEDQAHMMTDGAPRRQDYVLTLQRYGGLI